MNTRLEGIITPMITPLQADGTLDCVGLQKQIDRLLHAGIAGIFVLGTTGEGPALGRSLQQQMIRESVKIIAGRAPLLAGISAAAPDDSVELGLFAKQVGADAVVAAPPCYLPADDRELETFYRRLTSETGIPLYLYNMPAMTKINMSPELIIRLASIPGIVGYKDSAGDLTAFLRVLAALKDRRDFSVLMGPDMLMTEAVRHGAQGGVNGGSNLCPELFVTAYRAARRGDAAAVARLQSKIEMVQKVYGFRSHICCGVIVGLKAGLQHLGVCGVAEAWPARPAEPEVIAQVAAITQTLQSESYTD